MRSPIVFVLFIAASAALADARAQGGAQAGAQAGCELPNADIVVHGIRLGDSESTRRALGRDYRLVLSERASDYAWAIFASRDNKQLLRLRHHAGDLVDSYLEAEVKYGRDSRKPTNLRVYEFLSGQGIKLGMTRKQVVARFGPCLQSEKSGASEIIRYQIKAAAGALKAATLPAPLKAVNMPAYYAEYEFRAGRLIRFTFGYPPA